MVIEVKKSLYCHCGPGFKSKCVLRKAGLQLKSAHTELQSWLNGDLDEFWWYIPLTFCLATDLSSESIIVGCNEFEIKFEGMIQQLHGSRNPLEIHTKTKHEVFKTLAKFFIFLASKTEMPVNQNIVTKLIKKQWGVASSFENIKMWGFWNPAQHEIISSDSTSVILSSAYSTGKTTLLIGRAIDLCKFFVPYFISTVSHSNYSSYSLLIIKELVNSNFFKICDFDEFWS